ncbi:MAG: DUF1080 domain-containing protein [Gemmataceae bacterium]|nr:DUF1080 domain-containing protein [Gemmataceae bacterium]
MKRSLWIAMLLAAPALAADNTPPEGFTALFNGKDLSGWQGHITVKERVDVKGEALSKLKSDRQKLMEATWSVKDGVILHVPKVNDKGQKSGCSLQTIKDFGDFEWHIDWKIEKAGDSGLYLRGQPQVQIWDSENLSKNLAADAGTGSGGLWNNPLPKGVDPKSIGKNPLKKADKPVGEWNTFKIVMKGDKVTIHLNGELVIDKAALAPYKGFNATMPETGPLELQYHGDKLWFKNIYMKELK